MSAGRKLKRNKVKKFNKSMKGALTLFNKVPDECLMCEKEFEKTNKEHVSSWSVVVREKEDRINLYCPTCWERGQELVREIKGHLDGKKTNI